MSHSPTPQETHDADPLESIVPMIPFIIPIAGGLMIFLIAFIAVFMA